MELQRQQIAAQQNNRNKPTKGEWWMRSR
jgi:hypothetical protein